MTQIPRKTFLKALGAIVTSITAWSAKGAPKAPVRALESFTVPDDRLSPELIESARAMAIQNSVPSINDYSLLTSRGRIYWDKDGNLVEESL